MTKSDLINSIAEKANCTKKDAAAALEATLSSIQETLEGGEKVSITGLGDDNQVVMAQELNEEELEQATGGLSSNPSPVGLGRESYVRNGC